ncbi:DUF3179 domain-containing (seleno)protein [Haloferax sulfurifontis]|uniref:DUF3179 domain-containing protein n=1 Tax=Haloferax sulfurifontis ATCC BAA-897 TaxID=662480 RepID=M0HZQ1_9EURY|nr:DUF3179 domain-containing (seleno)protein [Haloferax sulfurifontis]ELZ89207.1 hypothetical protein C441_16969 [Haloferax sulfurifontis ATCC BAA-897]
MYRRTFLGVASGAAAGLAGCTEGSVRPPKAGPAPGNPDPVVAQGFPKTVCSAPPNPVDGAPTTFLVSGQLWQPPATRGFTSAAEGRVFGASVLTGDTELRNAANLVLYDEATGSYWSQLLATGICVPQSGEELAVLPSSVTTWAEWRADQPDTDVLLPPPWSETT